MSGYAFHATFLQALRDLGTTDQDDNVILETSMHWAPLPALEKAGNLSVSWSFLLSPLVNEYLPKPLARVLGLHVDKPTNVWFGAAQRPALPETGELLPTAVRVISLPKNLVAAVLSNCRQQTARLTGLLNVVVARALASALHSRGHDFASFKASTAIDLRRALSSGQGKIANYVSATDEAVVIDTTQLSVPELSDSDWLGIRGITSRLSAASQTLADQPVGLLKYLSNYREWTLKNARAPADSSFEISNLGVFDSSGDEATIWTVDQMLFSQSANGTGPPLNFSVASAKSGDLTISSTWWRGMLGVSDEEDFVNEVCKRVDDGLRCLAGQ
ncbi:Putative alcohol acetyltransferase/N-acetyltransferase [Septoria linicola]|uniref:Alcohol acetyltransferase/N-acetyltransferase n=1 Tax=Septoria linicola TaxID=215465 RepID=A0A9Q9AP47_9PEZI|nr:Putative alcohol acetyltransferase/N-acetyltransferase [Septoria linicola]